MRLSALILIRPARHREDALLDKLIAACFNSEDYQEGVRAFGEKHWPVCKGPERGRGEETRHGVIGLLILTVFLGLGAGSAAAQPRARVAHVGFVGPHSAGLDGVILRGFQERLAELGWNEHSLFVTYRWADGKFDRFPALAADLASAGVDVLVAPCGEAIQAVRSAHPTLPIVGRCMSRREFHAKRDGVDGVGEHTTGVTYFSPGATERRLQLLKAAIPRLTRLGLLYRPGSDWTPHLPAIEAVARKHRLTLYRTEWVDLLGPGVALTEAIHHGAQAMLTLGDGVIHAGRHQLFAVAAERKLPIMYDFPMFPAADGVGLMAYYADVAPLFRRVAEQVDAILKGTKPGDIPIAEPQQFRFMVNLKAARAMKLTLPAAVVRQADSVLK